MSTFGPGSVSVKCFGGPVDHSFVKGFLSIAFLFVFMCMSFIGTLACRDLGRIAVAQNLLNAGWAFFAAGMLIGLTVLIGRARASENGASATDSARTESRSGL